MRNKKYTPPQIVKKRFTARRYVACQHNFVSYQEIMNYLNSLSEEHPEKVSIEVIGQSKQGKDIYLAIIGDISSRPALSAVIEAGSNGSEFFTVSSALLLIDYLVKTPNALSIMKYLVIPCLNPDGYDSCLAKISRKGSKMAKCQIPTQKTDLTSEFPAIEEVHAKKFDPEVVAVYEALNVSKPSTRLFISLREDGRSILYPWGYKNIPLPDAGELKKIAVAGQKAMKNVTIGALAEKYCNIKGSVVDYVKHFHPQIKYVYAVHFNKEKKRKNTEIISKGEEVVEVVKAMSRRVFKSYLKSSSCLVQKEKVKRHE